MTSQQRKGDRRERELVNKLDDDNFGVTRIPSSGSATKRELPDIIAGNGDIYLAIEAKSSSGNPIYIPPEQIDGLKEFANRFGAKPRIAARFDREKWYFFNPDNLYTTNAGTYRIKKEDLPDGQDYHEATGQSTQTTL